MEGGWREVEWSGGEGRANMVFKRGGRNKCRSRGGEVRRYKRNRGMFKVGGRDSERERKWMTADEKTEKRREPVCQSDYKPVI